MVVLVGDLPQLSDKLHGNPEGLLDRLIRDRQRYLAADLKV
jgi:hypothetical protein